MAYDAILQIYSMEILKAAEAASGARNREDNRKAPNNIK
jgi:hypothetical protein